MKLLWDLVGVSIGTNFRSGDEDRGAAGQRASPVLVRKQTQRESITGLMSVRSLLNHGDVVALVEPGWQQG